MKVRRQQYEIRRGYKERREEMRLGSLVRLLVCMQRVSEGSMMSC
jgi:hypothetical protein